MKKTFQLIDLDCANCAQKMEDAVRKIDGVEDVTGELSVAENDTCRRMIRPLIKL